MNEDNTIHIYNGGSFSPPTIAHQKICKSEMYKI